MEKSNILYNFYKSYPNNSLITYKGVFDKHSLSVLGNYIKNLLADTPQLSRKMFNIFIELAQNVGRYSVERFSDSNIKDSGVGLFQIIDLGKQYSIHTGNMIMNYHIRKMEERCNLINNLNRTELRDYKRTQRSNGDSSSANIGMVQVALISCNYLEFEIIPVDTEKSFLNLGILLDKEENLTFML